MTCTQFTEVLQQAQPPVEVTDGTLCIDLIHTMIGSVLYDQWFSEEIGMNTTCPAGLKVQKIIPIKDTQPAQSP